MILPNALYNIGIPQGASRKCTGFTQPHSCFGCVGVKVSRVILPAEYTTIFGINLFYLKETFKHNTYPFN